MVSDESSPECTTDRRLVVVVGPTGAGKSSLAIALAKRCAGEVLSADSMQVYRGMDIGTGKVTAAERDGVPHHLLDVLNPDEEMTAAVFAQRADQVVADAAKRNAPLVVAGGTMLYVRVLLYGIFEGPGADEAIRARLIAEAEALGGAEKNGAQLLWQRLETIDSASADKIDPQDLRRIVRALEVYELTGEPLSVHHKRHNFHDQKTRYRVRLVGLSPERELLYERINQRVDRMVDSGLVDEVRALRSAGYTATLRSQRAIGYAELHEHLENGTDLGEATSLIKRNSRRYARRQLSWYRRDQEIVWHQEPSDVDLGELSEFLLSD